MTEEPTGNVLTPEQVAVQEAEQNKSRNQEEAFKRISEENKKFKEEKAEAEKLKAEEEQKKADEIAKNEDPEKFTKDQIKKELLAELKVDTEKKAKLNEVLAKYPKLAEHKETIERYLNDESRKNIPVDEIIVAAVGISPLLKMGAEIGSEALEQAEFSKTGGGSTPIETKSTEQKTQAAIEKKHMDSLPDGFK